MQSITPQSSSLAVPVEPIWALAPCLDARRLVVGMAEDDRFYTAYSLGDILVRRGWEQRGDSPIFERRGKALDAMAMIDGLADGAISEDEWLRFCNATGIGAELLTVASFPTPPSPVATHDPFVAIEGPEREFKVPAWGRVLGILVFIGVIALVASVKIAIRNATDDRAKADGVSNLEGNWASVRYQPQPDDYERKTTASLVELGEGNAAPSDQWFLHHPVPNGRENISLSHFTWKLNLDDPAQRKSWLTARNSSEMLDARQKVAPRAVTKAGYAGYEWVYNAPSGSWNYSFRAPYGDQSVTYTCFSPTDDAAFKSRCASILATMQIAGRQKEGA